jgi:hypothetical protein
VLNSLGVVVQGREECPPWYALTVPHLRLIVLHSTTCPCTWTGTTWLGKYMRSNILHISHSHFLCLCHTLELDFRKNNGIRVTVDGSSLRRDSYRGSLDRAISELELPPKKQKERETRCYKKYGCSPWRNLMKTQRGDCLRKRS